MCDHLWWRWRFRVATSNPLFAYLYSTFDRKFHYFNSPLDFQVYCDMVYLSQTMVLEIQKHTRTFKYTCIPSTHTHILTNSAPLTDTYTPNRPTDRHIHRHTQSHTHIRNSAGYSKRVKFGVFARNRVSFIHIGTQCRLVWNVNNYLVHCLHSVGNLL